MIAWVLIVSMGTTAGYTISGIESEQECKALLRQIGASYSIGGPSGYCYSYRAAYRF